MKVFKSLLINGSGSFFVILFLHNFDWHEWQLRSPCQNSPVVSAVIASQGIIIHSVMEPKARVAHYVAKVCHAKFGTGSVDLNERNHHVITFQTAFSYRFPWPALIKGWWNVVRVMELEKDIFEDISVEWDENKRKLVVVRCREKINGRQVKVLRNWLVSREVRENIFGRRSIGEEFKAKEQKSPSNFWNGLLWNMGAKSGSLNEH